MLKPLLLALMLLLPLNSWAATAQAYLGFFGGAIEVEGMDTEKAEPLILNLGYRVNAYWALQLEYSEARFNGAVKTHTDGRECDVDYSTLAGYMLMILPAGAALDLNLKAGYLEADYSFTDGQMPDIHQRFNSSGFAYGAGVTVKASREMVLTLDYTQLRGDASQLSAGVEFAL